MNRGCEPDVGSEEQDGNAIGDAYRAGLDALTKLRAALDVTH